MNKQIIGLMVSCLILTMLVVSCGQEVAEVEPTSENELTAEEVLERAIEAINQVESFHVSVTQKVTTPEETFILSEWDGVTKCGYGLFVVARSVDPSSREVTEYEALFLADGKTYIRPSGSDIDWSLLPLEMSQVLAGSIQGLQRMIFGQVVDLNETLQRYIELTRSPDESFGGEAVYVLKGAIDVQTILEQMTTLFGIPSDVLESIEIDWNVMEQTSVRHKDYLPVQIIAVNIATLEMPDEQVTISYEGEMVLSNFNAPVELPQIEGS